MKQKDKRRQRPASHTRLRNISLPDLDVLDDVRERTEFKTRRTSLKQHDSFKVDAELVPGRILEIKSNYLYIVEAGNETHTATLSGRLRQFLYSSRTLSAVGDRVELDTSVSPDYRIENILPRKNTFSRYSQGSFQKEIILAANIDQVVVTASWLMPMLKPGLIDRYLCIANLQGLGAVVVINKIDLCEDRSELDELLSYYRDCGYQTFCTSTLSGEGMPELREALKGKDSVFSGQSGTGKSSLINWLEPGLDLDTAEVSDFNEKGKHTTSQSILIPWSFGGHILDTPGIKTINLHSDAKPMLPKIFPGFSQLAERCRFRDCTHSHEEDCSVLDAVDAGNIPPERYESYLRIMDSL